MDVAYDHIQEEALSPQDETDRANRQQTDLNTEFQQAFQAVSASPWGSKLGGWFSQARTQGESWYSGLQKEASEASEQATKGLAALQEQVASRARGLSLDGQPAPAGSVPGEEGVPGVKTTEGESKKEQEEHIEKPESLPADIVKEASSLVASLRLTAASKLKDIQKAEDAADEALLRFGTNVRNFLRDAVTITAPDADTDVAAGRDTAGNEVLFETSDPGTGRKVFHTTRLDAQLHAIHMRPSSFIEDPAGGENWDQWSKSFDIDKKTENIAADLDKFEELRRAMEKLVPEKVEYKNFWMRYYFLRSAVEEEEKKRKEVLKGAAADAEEEVAWDDEDDEAHQSLTPNANAKASESTTTLSAPPQSKDQLKPKEPRRSHEEENKSVADSDASYDIVSGATSRTPGSPKDEKKKDAEDSDEDWE